MLYRLVYRSRHALAAETASRELDELVTRARAANARAGITGALLLADGHFLQAIEGPLEPLEALFERICTDFRHRDVQLLEFGPVEERLFAGWAMEAAEVGAELVARLPLAAGGAASGALTLELLRSQVEASRAAG